MTKIQEEDDDDEAGEEEALLPSGSFDGSPRVRLTLDDGSELLAQAAVVATEAPAAAALLGEDVALGGGASPSTGRSSTCLYFAIDGPAPVRGVVFYLGSGCFRVLRQNCESCYWAASLVCGLLLVVGCCWWWVCVCSLS